MDAVTEATITCPESHQPPVPSETDDLAGSAAGATLHGLTDYALATTSRTSALSNVTPAGTFAAIRSAAALAASSDSNTSMDFPLVPSSERVQ